MRGNPPSPTRAERRRQETRDEIVRAASDTFSEKGYHATRIEDIVGRMGAGQGTFYRYFDSKRTVLDAVLESIIQRVHELFTADNAPEVIRSLADYRERAGNILDRLFILADREREALRVLLVEAPSVDADMGRLLLGLTDVFEALAAEYYNSGIGHGFFRPDLDVPAAATVTVGIGAGALIAVVKHPSDTDVRDRYRATVLDFIVRFAAQNS